MKETTKSKISDLLSCMPALKPCEDSLERAIEALIDCYKSDHKLMVCGNGGSASDALHIVGELMKGFALPRSLRKEAQDMLRAAGGNAEYIISNLQGALPAISLVSEISLLTAYSNDIAPDMVFAQQVFGHGRAGDILIAISTSGNSKNVLYACEVAKAIGVKVIALTGDTGGLLKELSDILINVPEKEVFKIQNLHIPVYHTICLAVENEFFGLE